MNAIINKIKSYSFFNNDTYCLYAFSLLFGMLGTLMITIISHCMARDEIKIGTVNLTGMVDQFIKQESAKNVQQDELQKETKQFGSTLNKVLQSFSKENNMILMPSEAIIAGTRDYTTIINERLQQIKDN